MKKTARDYYNEHFSDFISWREFNFNFNISLKNKYLYVETAKVACSTIKTRLHDFECHELNMVPERPHPPAIESPMIKPYQLDYDHLHQVTNGEEYFKFSFVRNPYSRVLSGYLEKINGQNRRKTGMLAAAGLPADSDISFLEFLKIIEGQKSIRMNKHWRDQVSLLCMPIIKYDFMGRFENFEEDWGVVRRRVFSEDIKQSSDSVSNKHATNSGSKIKKYYGPSEIELLKRKYAADFEEFGYDPNVSA